MSDFIIFYILENIVCEPTITNYYGYIVLQGPSSNFINSFLRFLYVGLVFRAIHWKIPLIFNQILSDNGGQKFNIPCVIYYNLCLLILPHHQVSLSVLYISKFSKLLPIKESAKCHYWIKKMFTVYLFSWIWTLIESAIRPLEVCVLRL